MKFLTAMLLIALVAVVNAAVEKQLEPTKQIEPTVYEADGQVIRDRRGVLHGAYSAPLATAAVEVAAPVAYTYSASVPYAYSAYRAYAPYYSYPVVYV